MPQQVEIMRSGQVVKKRGYPIKALHHLCEQWHVLRQPVTSCLCRCACCLLRVCCRTSLSICSSISHRL